MHEANESLFPEKDEIPQTQYASLVMDQIPTREEERQASNWTQLFAAFPEAAIWAEIWCQSAARRQLARGTYRESFPEESLRIVIHIKTQEVWSLGGLFE